VIIMFAIFHMCCSEASFVQVIPFSHLIGFHLYVWL
jgi:hypothetical protein